MCLSLLISCQMKLMTSKDYKDYASEFFHFYDLMTRCLHVSLLSIWPHLSSSEFIFSIISLSMILQFTHTHTHTHHTHTPHTHTHITNLYIHTTEYSIYPHLPPKPLSYFNSVGWMPEIRAQRPRKWGLSSSTCSVSLFSKAFIRDLEPTIFLSVKYKSHFRLEVKQQE